MTVEEKARQIIKDIKEERLIANREMPILKKANEIMSKL